MESLTDKSIIVTGSARGIGEALARELAAHRARVVIADLDEVLGATVAASINDGGGTAVSLKVDISRREMVTRAVDMAVSEFGSLDCMVNNAGVIQVKPFMSISEADWHFVMDINGMGALIGMQEAARAMISQNRGGKIINVASITGKLGAPDTPHYSASKAAVISLTQSGAREFAKHGITVNAICPGVVDTDMWKVIGQDMHREGWTKTPEDALQWKASNALLGRASVAQDLVGIVRFLASGESDFITGQSIVVDGGIVFS